MGLSNLPKKLMTRPCHGTTGATMADMTDRPILFYGEAEADSKNESSNKNSLVYMIQMAHGPPEEPYPGAPVAIFYDYGAARAALETYEHPLSSCFSDTVIIAFLTASRVSPYGILSYTQICAHKTNKDPTPQPISIWG